MNPVNLEVVSQAKKTLIDLAIRYGPKVVTAIILLLIGISVTRRVGGLMQSWLTKRELDVPLRQLLVRLASALLFMVFFMMALQNLGVELLPLFASLGVAGVGVGLAMQGVLSNLVAGLTIIFTRPFRVGEYVALAGVSGQVDSITLFSTKLGHTDGSIVVVPNRKIVGDILHNYGKSRQLDLAVGVAYGTDIGKALSIVHEALNQNARVLKDPKPVVQVTLLADSSINIAIRPWVLVGDYVPAPGEIFQAVLLAYQAQGIQISFPQREVRLLTSPAGSA